MQFNKDKFSTEVQRIHIKPEDIAIYDAIPDDKVRAKLDEFVEYGKNPRFSAALDAICANLVGKTMFRLLMTKMSANETCKKRGKIKTVEYLEDGSTYSPTDFAVKINLSFYNEDSIGIASRQYYYVNYKGDITTKLKSFFGSIFHEFCHALHDISGNKIAHNKNTICLDKSILKNIWTKDEELRTITCFNGDPICDHCFDFFMNEDSFHPRYGHGGYVKDAFNEQKENEIREELKQHLPLSKKFMDGWKEYVI